MHLNAIEKYCVPANVFGVVQNGELRLVADFREINVAWEASSELPPLHTGLLASAVSDCAETVVGDCSGR